MVEPRRILTVHSPVPQGVLDVLLTSIESALRERGATRVWIDAHYCPELVVMAEMPIEHAPVLKGDLAELLELVPDEGAPVVVPQPR